MTLVVLFFLLPATTAVAATTVPSLAVFPLQDIGHGSNGLNMHFTRYLVERLEASGTKVSRLETVIAFMSNNRIRSPGHLETFHIGRLREELGVGFVLLGTVIQNKEKPSPLLGVTLNLVRTSDARTMWTYVGSVSSADERKLLGIGEAKSVEDLEPVLGDEIMALWPGDSLKQEPQGAASIDSIVLQPRHVVPGAEVYCSVRLRNLWLEGRAPRVFVKADDQIYATTFAPENNAYEVTWVAGQTDGRYPVTLILEWPFYGRTETVQLGYYLVDGVAPLLAMNLRGEALEGDPPVFSDEVMFVPLKVIRKPIVRWYIKIQRKDDILVADRRKKGELPEVLVWEGLNSFGGWETAGTYKVTLQVWDEAGNTSSATNSFKLDKRAPLVKVAAAKEGREVKLDLTHDSKVPLAFWRLEMWSKEGTLLKTAEGKDLPTQIGMELPEAGQDQDIEGTLVVQDILGNRKKSKLDNLLLPPEPQKTEEQLIKEKTATKAWVEEF